MTHLASRMHLLAVRRSTPQLLRLIAKGTWLTVAAASWSRGPLGASGAVARFWKWQLGRRLRGGALDLELNPQGIRFRVPAWSQIGGMIVANGSHEPSETSFFTRTLKPGDVFYDVGANIGLYTVLAAHAGARVVTFEPDERAGGALHDNVSLASAEDLVDIRSVALADYDGEARFTTGLEVGNHLEAATDGDGDVTVMVCRLDTLADDGQLHASAPGCLAFLKVDAEGHDLEVLQGATDLLRRHRPVVMVETWAGGAEVRHFLCGFGYRVYQYDERRRTLTEYPATWAGQANFLAIHASQLPDIEARLTASSVSVAVAPPTILGWTEL